MNSKITDKKIYFELKRYRRFIRTIFDDEARVDRAVTEHHKNLQLIKDGKITFDISDNELGLKDNSNV